MVTVLDFRLSHARARDAVMAEFDVGGVADRLVAAGFAVHTVATAVADKKTYLVRPNLGRQLDAGAREQLVSVAPGGGARDLVIIVSDGLAAQAAERHAVETVTLLAGLLCAAGWSLYPILLAPFGRVKLQDEIGEVLGARHALMLLGERPGLGMPDSLGAYLTHHPSAGCMDADRNGVSNIRPEGLPPAAAARKLAHLLIESARLGASGVELKDTERAEDGGNLRTERSERSEKWGQKDEYPLFCYFPALRTTRWRSWLRGRKGSAIPLRVLGRVTACGVGGDDAPPSR